MADEVYRNGGCNWDSSYSKMIKVVERYLAMGTPLEDTDIEAARNAALEINNSKGCCDMEPVDLLKELAVKWVSLNSDPIELGKVSYKR